MFIKKHFHKIADLKLNNNSMIISETKHFRDQYMSEVFYNIYKDEISKFKTTGKTALLYCAGAVEHHSSSRIFPVDVQKSNIVIKSHTGYIASKIAKRIGNISYMSINANTCASSMYAIYEAYSLLQYQGFDDVIIYGEEWVEDVELLLFKQFNINVVCSDGFFILQLGKYSLDEEFNEFGCIFKPSWIWNDDRSAFEVSKSGYIEAMSPFKDSKIDFVKMHGTGTAQNDKAENEAIKELFGNIETLEYKSKIGHSQGCSTGIELCKLIEDYKLTNYKFSERGNRISRRILVNASGLGNFYGSFLVVL
ncbi:hypothetical protein ACNSOO_04715 [Aliarcobacter lanthieri]|uniref:hypothetical protein n=1 Tax=Aliarcobacter lanthieri TaxID=1355374 RepID=UPI003AAD8041